MPSTATKVSWLFNGYSPTSTGTSWGFSETWYTPVTDPNAIIVTMDIISRRRVAMLARDTSIVAYRIGQTGGRALTVRRTFNPPPQNDISNVQIDSALCQVKVTGIPSQKRFWLHDLPDDWIHSGVATTRLAQVRDMVKAYCDLGYQVRYQIPNALNAQVLSITALGVVTTVQPFAIALNSFVQFLRCKDTNGRVVRGRFVVGAVNPPNGFTISNWTGQTVGRSGNARLVSFDYGVAEYLGEASLLGSGGRKVGRPFFQSRGRAVVRK